MSRKVHVRFCRRAEGGDPLRLAGRVTTIAAYLAVDRKTVSAVLKRWIAEGVAGVLALYPSGIA